MGKRKPADSSDDDDDDDFVPARAKGGDSPERPLVQTARRSGKKAKVGSLLLNLTPSDALRFDESTGAERIR